jgi:hypothetical protein
MSLEDDRAPMDHDRPLAGVQGPELSLYLIIGSLIARRAVHYNTPRFASSILQRILDDDLHNILFKATNMP